MSGNNAELSLEHQINYIESFLMFDQTTNESLNPFIGISNGVALKEIRKSLLKLKNLEERLEADVIMNKNG
jgi:hypothetical protein